MRFFLSIIIVLFVLPCFSQSWKPINGSKDSRNHHTAFTNATIFIKAGEILENATLLIQKDKIVAVGNSIELPPNTLIIDLKGKYIYPSFIELHSQYGVDALKKNKSERGPQLNSKKDGIYYWNESIKPEIDAADLIKHQQKEAEKYRKMGFGSVLSHQMDGLIRGTSVLSTLSDKNDFRILKEAAAMHYSFSRGITRQSYPSSLMGMIALIKQAHHDAS